MRQALDLNLRHLRLLGEVGRCGSLSVASRSAGISQPALTQAIAKLENEFAVPLFTRTSRGVTPTPAGARVVHRVDRAIALLGRALRQAGTAGSRAAMERRLTTAHVRGLLGVAEGGSFLKGAEVAGVSVPALHRSVRDLERLTGSDLFERRGRGMVLTNAGAKMARGFMLGVAELATALDEGGHGSRRLAIGAMALSRSLLLPTVLAELLRTHPHVQIDVVEGSYLELVELLRSGRIDVMVGALRAQLARDLHQEALFADRLMIIGRATHPLNGSVAGFEDLAAYPWIVARRASGLLERWQSLFDRAAMPRPEAPIQCGSVALIRGMLVRSDLLTLLSPDQVSAEIEAGSLVVIRSVVPDTERIIGVITRRDWHPTDLQTTFMTILKATSPSH